MPNANANAQVPDLRRLLERVEARIFQDAAESLQVAAEGGDRVIGTS